MLSIIIPTKNEENYLPLLLNSAKSQDFSDLEIIVADAFSIDRTREIAKNYGCKIVDGGVLPKGRNNGAKNSKGDLLLFCDADIILPDGFLKKALKEIDEKKLDVAGTLQRPISVNKKFKDLKYKIIYGVANQWMKIMQYTPKPFMQSCIFAKKEIHEKINGFDETLIFGEDSEYAKRAKKFGKFGILNSDKVFISPRRFEEEGAKLIFKNLYFIIGKIFGYEFRENSRIKYYS
jgi:glycosyltransferase involved in cell wall biosynthesis